MALFRRSPSWHDITVSEGSFYSHLLLLFFHVEQSDTESLSKSNTTMTINFTGEEFGGICDVMVIQHVVILLIEVWAQIHEPWPKIHQWQQFSPACRLLPAGSMPGDPGISCPFFRLQWVHVTPTLMQFYADEGLSLKSYGWSIFLCLFLLITQAVSIFYQIPCIGHYCLWHIILHTDWLSWVFQVRACCTFSLKCSGPPHDSSVRKGTIPHDLHKLTFSIL